MLEWYVTYICNLRPFSQLLSSRHFFHKGPGHFLPDLEKTEKTHSNEDIFFHTNIKPETATINI